MRLYNTLTRKIEEFIPNEAGIVRMYTCGPTVYNYAHIGNLRTYISEDILEKGLVPLLYTDYNYIPSNKAYINVGYKDEGILINFSCSK